MRFSRPRRPLLPVLALFALVLPAASSRTQERPQDPAGDAAESAPAAEVAVPPEPGASYFVLPAELPAGAWLEITPLGPAGESRVLALEGDTPEILPLSELPELPGGPAMVCTGAADAAVGCRRVFLRRAPDLLAEARTDPLYPEVDDSQLAVELDFASGLEIRGRYLLDGLPVEGVRVALVPAGLEASRAFTVPFQRGRALGRGPFERVEGSLVREVVSSEDGRFRLPPVRGGRYRLEALLPTGRVHRPEPFELPAAEDAAAESGPLAEGEEVVWEFGDLDVTDWLAFSVIAVDERGEPIEGVQVTARQGSSPRRLMSFRGRTDADGNLRLSGFDPERPLRLDCSAEGHAAWGADFELLPVEVVCAMDRLARVEGQLLGLDGEPLDGGVLSARGVDSSGRRDLSGESATGAIARPAAEGAFALELAPGEYTLTAAAPGRLSDSRVLRLAAGDRLELGAISLAPGRELQGRVVEAAPPPDGPPPLVAREREPAPIPFAEVRAIEPPGAAFATADADGLFAISSIGASLELEVRAEGFAAERLVIEASEQRRREPFTVELHRGGWIRVVVSQGDEPCAGCSVRLLPSGPELVTGGDGEALSPALRPGLYRLEKPRLLHLGSQVVEIPAALSRRARVVADEISTVRFELEPQRLPLRFEPHPGDAWWLIARTPSGEERLEQDDTGHFHVPRPRGAARELFLTRFDPASGHDLEVRVATLEPSFRPPPAGESIILPLPSGAVHGRISGQPTGERSLRPLAGVRVRLQTVADGAHAAEMRTDAEGHFHLPHIPPGVYSLVLGERAFQFVSLAEGTRLDLGEFQLVDGAF